MKRSLSTPSVSSEEQLKKDISFIIESYVYTDKEGVVWDQDKATDCILIYLRHKGLINNG